MKFDLIVYVTRRPHMRDEGLEYELYMGRGVLSQIFDREEVNEAIEHVYFSYPERWLNIVEERSLYQRLDRYCPNLKSVKIKTQSVYIIQSTPNGCVRIVSGPEESKAPSLTQAADSGRLWFPNVVNIIDPSKINVI